MSRAMWWRRNTSVLALAQAKMLQIPETCEIRDAFFFRWTRTYVKNATNVTVKTPTPVIAPTKILDDDESGNVVEEVRIGLMESGS
mmetsp:Transcript_42993/g.69763  ORF Transcript_42993/g.69763 Transcript_42993/m.69763 type:complete len:86 (+) Transcript_42993:131-388(+)